MWLLINASKTKEDAPQTKDPLQEEELRELQEEELRELQGEELRELQEEECSDSTTMTRSETPQEIYLSPHYLQIHKYL